MKELIFLLILIYAFQVLAKNRKPVAVYIDTPPHRKPYVSTADKNRLYSERNPIRRVDPEVKKYLEKLAADKKWRKENMSRNKEPTPANNRPQ